MYIHGLVVVSVSGRWRSREGGLGPRSNKRLALGGVEVARSCMELVVRVSDGAPIQTPDETSS